LADAIYSSGHLSRPNILGILTFFFFTFFISPPDPLQMSFMYIRHEIPIPLLATGGLRTPYQAEHFLPMGPKTATVLMNLIQNSIFEACDAITHASDRFRCHGIPLFIVKKTTSKKAFSS